MNAKRQLKNCTYLGSYCKTRVLGACVEKREAYCYFHSLLSRIIQEQVRPQLGLTWREPQTPRCEGIPVERLAEIDWKKVNLDEWLGILQKNGHYPDPKKLTPEALTG
jgi:conjugal transfer mating pair stabilization protein TraN